MKFNPNRVPLLRLAPEIWKLQFFTKLFLVLMFAAFRVAANALGVAVALNVESCLALFRTWQGVLLASAFLVAAAVYVSMDLNVKILYAGNVADGVRESIFSTLRRAFASMPKFLNFQGLSAVLYMTLVAPFLAAGIIVFTDAPNLYRVYYLVAAFAFAALGAAHIFCPLGVLLDGLSVRESRKQAKNLVWKYWRHFLGENLTCGLSLFSFLFLSAILFFIFPVSLGGQFLPAHYDATTARSLMILILFLNGAFFLALSLLAAPRYVLQMTKLYREYLSDAPAAIPERATEKHPLLAALAFLYIIEIAAVSSQTVRNFDEFFPTFVDTRIIAHRSCGIENAENTRSGLETAIALGVYASEIDVQRTSDGHYVITHDDTFGRVAQDGRAPKEMTLEEIKALRHPVPTLEEMLDAANGRIQLLVELKGETANYRMCYDVVRMIRERDMTDQIILMSFRRDLMQYVEKRWPEIRTGCFVTVLDERNANLKCDYIGLEEKAATPAAIRTIHANGQKLLVWTPDAPDAQERFLVSGADAIITNQVKRAQRISDSLNRQDDFGRILSAFRP